MRKNFGVFFVVLALVAAGAMAAGKANAALVNYWSGDGNANDSVGSDNGTWVGTEAYAPGLFGQAFSLDGVSYIQCPNTTYAPNGTQSFTIDLWANFNVVQSGADGYLPNVFVSQDEGIAVQPENKWVFFSDGSDLGFHLNGTGGFAFLTEPFSPSTNQWYNLAVTRSGSSFSFYVNGALIGTQTSDISIPIPNAYLTIGWAESNPEFPPGFGYFNGELEGIAIYDYALTQAQIQSLTNAPVPLPSAFLLLAPGLVALVAIRRRFKR